MKITLKTYDIEPGDAETLLLDDGTTDNDNFVTLSAGKTFITVALDELAAATTAFLVARKNSLEREVFMTDSKSNETTFI